MKRHCYALDLRNDPVLIAEYEQWHMAENGWPEIRKSIIDAGIIDMQIYRTGNRLFMIMDTHDCYDPVTKAAMDAVNPKVQEWEQLMWKFQQPLPWAAKDEKWVPMAPVFYL
jgi:L-rhamnose mutarotase